MQVRKVLIAAVLASFGGVMANGSIITNAALCVDTATVFTSVTNIYTNVVYAGHINADLTLDQRSYVRLTGADQGQKNLSDTHGLFYIGTNANDVTITVKGNSVFAGTYRNSKAPDAWVATGLDRPAGDANPRRSYINMHVGLEGGTEGSTGHVLIKPQTGLSGWGGNVFSCFWAYRLYVESSITPNDSGYVDLFEVGTDAFTDIGTLFVKHAKPVRIRFRGGQWHRNNSTFDLSYLFDVPAGKSLILEGDATYKVYISKRFNDCTFTSAAGGDTYVRGKDVMIQSMGSVFQGYTGYNFFPWTLTAAQKVHWEHSGDLHIWTQTWFKLKDHDLLPYGPAHGLINLHAESGNTYQPGNAAGNVGYGCIDLAGTTQHVNSVISNNNNKDWYQGLVTNSTPAVESTLVMGSWNNDSTLNARCCEGVKVLKEGTGLLSVKSTRGVTLEVVGGRADFSLANAAVPNCFTNVIVAAGAKLSGTLPLLGGLTVHGAAPSMPAFNLELASGAAITLDDAEATLELGQLKVNGAIIPTGEYTAGSVAWLTAGKVRVLASGPNTAGNTYTWKGGADGDSVFSADNWNEGLPNFTDGKAVLDFSTGSANAVFDGDAKAFALHFGARDFTLSGSGKVTVFDGGVTSGVGTVTISAPMLVGWPQTWFAPTGAVMEVAGDLSGASFSGELALDGGATFKLGGDNSELHSRVRLKRGSKAQASCDNALGAADGEFTAEGTLANSASTGKQDFLFVGNRNVNTPFSHVNVLGYVNEVGKTVVFKEPVKDTTPAGKTDGMANNTNGRLVFEGGLDVSVSSRYFFIMNSGSEVVFTNQPVNAYVNGGVFAFNLGNSATAATVPKIIFAVQGNKWYILRVFAGHIVCAGEDVLDASGSICFGRMDWTSYVDSDWFKLNLNGHDQTLGGIVTGWNVTPPSEGSTSSYNPARFACITSAVPAKLTVNPVHSPYKADYDWYLAAKFRGEAALKFAPSSTYGNKLTIIHHVSDTKGSLEVASGTLVFAKGGGWGGSTNVTLSGTGKISVDADSAEGVFGGATAKTVMYLEDDGVLDIPAGSIVRVRRLEVNGVRMPKGTYGGTGSGAADVSLASHFTANGGVLSVRYKSEPGTALLLR